MTRSPKRPRTRIPFVLLAALPAWLSGCGGGTDGEMPPSLILVSLDTLRADHMGLHGYGRDTTPYLDRLANECVVYEHAFTTAPWTLVAHMTMFTGLYPDQHGVLESSLALSPEVPMLAERLQERGYQTIALYKPGWIHERHGYRRGFDKFIAHENAEEAALHLEQVLDDLNPNRPYFLFLHLFDIHSSPETEDSELYYAPGPPHDRTFIADAPERFQGVNWEQVWLREAELSEAQLDALVALYDGGIRMVDGYMETWIEDWRERGLLDDALLAITSDHGEPLGQREGRIRGHGAFFQEGLWVPLMLRYPDRRGAGTRVEDLVSHVDLLPTFLDFLGQAAATGMPGYSLLDELPKERVILASKPPHTTQIQWPYKVWRKGDEVVRVFDLAADPLELNLLPGAAVARQLDQAWQSEFSGARTYAPAIEAREMSAAEAAELDALGYAGH